MEEATPLPHCYNKSYDLILLTMVIEMYEGTLVAIQPRPRRWFTSRLPRSPVTGLLLPACEKIQQTERLMRR